MGLRSSDWCPCKKIKHTETQRRHTGEESHVKKEVEIGMIQLQTKECQRLLEATRS